MCTNSIYGFWGLLDMNHQGLFCFSVPCVPLFYNKLFVFFILNYRFVFRDDFFLYFWITSKQKKFMQLGVLFIQFLLLVEMVPNDISVSLCHDKKTEKKVKQALWSIIVKLHKV